MTQGQTLILVGAGHVHQQLLERAGRWRRHTERTVLISPSSFRYGGSVTPLLAGSGDPKTLKRSATRTCRAAGATYRCDRVVGIEPRSKRLWLASGEPIAFDVLSLNIGYARLGPDWSVPAAGEDAPAVWAGVSVAELSRLRSALVDATPGTRVAVVGASQRAVEIVAGLSAAGDLADIHVALYIPGDRVLDSAPTRAATRIARILAARGVDIVTQTEVDAVGSRALLACDGRRFRADHIVVAGSPRAASLVQAAGRPRNDSAGLIVDRRLSAVRGLDYLASGGCASLGGRVGLPPADSRAQARVIAANLIACTSAQAIERYSPPRPEGAIDLGQDTGVAWWRGWTWPSTRLPRAIARSRNFWLHR
ncbi:MAG: FAD-dependent oxidoreductase [Salinisphaera sp.]|jgi:NADH dehydrogenase FAD-containing subunit|nr:FAD-dependent oxidoreductase [Salinisphaera sp.]